ncbi:MAG: TetR/AcrR family transcriptional regulator [Myxococcales bacterium]|jgi:AcrR family transcriptional regulator|nr:MAG: TetR/AcrR family transcriptional regulator [Myxococcales bacterium]
MPRKNRSDWLRAGLRRLARSGIDSIRVEPLAKELGVTKGSFYWHFSDRTELLDAMLEEWAETATEAVIAQAEDAGDEPQARLKRLTTIAAEGFDAQLELALREWGRRDRAVGGVLDEIDGRRMSYLRQLLRESGFEPIEVEARAFLLYSALLGHALLPHSHARFSRHRVLREAVGLLLASSSTTTTSATTSRSAT